jgi:hypothetical protein
MYVTALVRELLALSQRAPYRTSILVSRVLPSERHRERLVAAMVGAGPEIQNALAAAGGEPSDAGCTEGAPVASSPPAVERCWSSRRGFSIWVGSR